MNSRLNLRPAEEKDCRLLWKWRNEKLVRDLSFNSEYISYGTHKKWFEKKIKSKNTDILIIADHGNPVGMIRFDLKPESMAEVNIVIDKTERSRGYGLKALKLSCRYVFKKTGINGLIAYVKKDNAASLRTFEKAGFSNEGLKKIKRCNCYRLLLKK
jgi:UDP-2,4-diacetamido-2,4,6-trideoxy-beta-L-altropyranose hydrolase